MTREYYFRVLHAPTSVGGNPQQLSRTLNEIGVDSTSLVLGDNYYRYTSDIVLFDKKYPLLVREAIKLGFIISIPFRFDVVHYNFGTTVAEPVPPLRTRGGWLRAILKKVFSGYSIGFQRLELFYLRLFSIPMFVHYQGDDARQGAYCRKHFEITAVKEEGIDYYTEASDLYKQRAIKRIAEYCDRIYSVNPDLLHVLPEWAEFVPYNTVDFDDWMPNCTTRDPDSPLRIGHAPTSRLGKGTQYIETAVEILKAEGHQFEFVLIEGLDNEAAKRAYQTIDVMVDQLLHGWYGGLAVEVMALEKPVIVYLREDDFEYLDPKMVDQFPFIQANPHTICDVLRNVIEMPREQLREMGRKSRAYAIRWHDPTVIASKIKSDYVKALRKRGKLVGVDECAE